MDITDRGRRPEQRYDAVEHQRSQHEHVVALVAVPRAACGQVGQSEHRRKDEQRRQCEAVDRRGATIDHAGAIRLRALPVSWNAAFGNARNGLPAHSALARAMLTLSYPTSIPGVSRM